MRTPTLGLSLLGAEFKALVFEKGGPVAQWESTEACEPSENLTSQLRELLCKTQPDGREVGLVLAHPRLNDQIVEIPPAKGWILEQLLERQAQSSKTFHGTAVWSRQPALPTKKANAVLLHLLPKANLDQLSYACQQAHLRLVRVLPTSAVLIGQLKALPLEKDEVGLIAAETGASTTIVIGRKDGRVALGRVLANGWSNAPERVWVDLTRSIGFAEQQCGVTVGSVWLFGQGAARQLDAVQAILKVPVRLSPVPFTPYYWAEQAARLSEKNDGSLISLEVRLAPRRRKILAATLFILLLLVLMSLGAAGAVEVVRQVELNSARDLDRVIAKFHERKAEWEGKYAEAARKKELITLVTEQTVPPVPVWLLAYLGEVLPDDLVLDQVRVFRTNESWSLRLAGRAYTELAPSATPSSSRSGQSFGSLTNRLATGPFRVQITRGAFGNLAAVRASSLATAQSRPLLDQFVLEGTIR